MPEMPRAFRPRHMRSEAQRRRDDDRRRGSARERGYSARWDRAAALFRRQHPVCLGCSAVDRIEATTVVDHVVPHGGDAELFWDEDNWQGCCAWHHDVIKQLLERLYAAGELTADDLRLDSAAAVRLTKELDPRSA